MNSCKQFLKNSNRILFSKRKLKLQLGLFILSLNILGFISCGKEAKNTYNSTEVNHEKIDAAFGNDVSKILFDHLYIVVDSLTYDNLKKNKNWQKRYATLDQGLPNFLTVTDSTSTCYLRGHQHYIEILGPDNKYNEPIGKSGIGFSLKNKGEHFHLGLEAKVKTAKDSALYASEIVKMPIENRKHTWFKAFYTPSQGTALHTWYGFYNPTFLNALYKKPHLEYSRKAFLQASYAEQKLFNGINEIHLNCTLVDFKRIAKELSSLKCKLLEKNEKTYTIASGDITIKISYSDQIGYSRITKIICVLNDEDHSHIKLGNLSITNKGSESIWDLQELYKHNP